MVVVFEWLQYVLQVVVSQCVGYGEIYYLYDVDIGDGCFYQWIVVVEYYLCWWCEFMQLFVLQELLVYQLVIVQVVYCQVGMILQGGYIVGCVIVVEVVWVGYCYLVQWLQWLCDDVLVGDDVGVQGGIEVFFDQIDQVVVEYGFYLQLWVLLQYWFQQWYQYFVFEY